MTQAICNWDPAFLLIFSDNVFSPLIYYSHFGPIIVSLLIGFVVLLSNPRALANRVLFALTVFFSIWVYFDLILWGSERPDFIMFFWSIMTHAELLFYISGVYLVMLFANKGRDISFRTKVVFMLFFLPALLFTHTSYNLLGFDYTTCDREPIEGALWQYIYIIELVFVGWATIVALRGYRRLAAGKERKQFLLVSIGTILMLLLFNLGNFIVTYFLSVDWSFEQAKLISMPIFVAFIGYSIVKFKTFNSKLIAAQALIFALGIAVLSLMFVQTIPNIRIIAGVTFIFVCILGYLLIRSVQREIEQREHIEKLAGELAETNERQEVLMHFIGHEVKGTLAKDSGVFASISEGDLGPVPETVKTFVDRALVESRNGATSVENILKASNLKKGSVTYTKESFDLKALVAEVVEKAKVMAEQKGLTLTFVADEPGAPYTLNGDKAKLGDNVFRNLVENSINYTPTGSVSISLKKENGEIIFTVKDTGIGITEEDKKRLFTEGGHGKDSQKVNAHSTGYGLFIAKGIAEAHGGTIRAESEGEGKGSTFIVEFPAA